MRKSIRSGDHLTMSLWLSIRDREGTYSILGPYTNEQWTKENAFKMADEQVVSAKDAESYFIHFNRGSAQVDLE